MLRDPIGHFVSVLIRTDALAGGVGQWTICSLELANAGLLF